MWNSENDYLTYSGFTIILILIGLCGVMLFGLIAGILFGVNMVSRLYDYIQERFK